MSLSCNWLDAIKIYNLAFLDGGSITCALFCGPSFPREGVMQREVKPISV